ncbi:MAG: hypothetical protein WD377_08075 [Nitriliruptoraceae bacterium]
MRTVSRKLSAVVCAAALVLLLLTPAAIAAESGSGAEDGDHRIALAETPRDRLGLLLLGALVVGGGAALVNARRQLRGDRPQASGEFRWR